MSIDVNSTEYYIGQALAGLLAARGDDTPDDKIDAIADKAVRIGRATHTAATAAKKANETKLPSFKMPE